MESQGFYQGNDQIWVPKQKKAAVTNRSHQDIAQPKTSKTTKMGWVREDTSATYKSCPSPPTHVPCKRAATQEPTWRRVTSKTIPQKVEPQEPALNNKGKGKIVDVTNIPSSSTSMTF